MEKEFVRADQLVRDAFTLARRVYESGYKPDVLLVLWRGGSPIGVVIHEFFLYMGIHAYHATVKVESYTGIGIRGSPRIEHIEPVLKAVQPGSSVLVVDDIFDTGRTIGAVCDRLRPKTSRIKVATLYVKEHSVVTSNLPDFWLRTTNRWVVFPHELVGLSLEEIREKDQFLYEMIRTMSGTHRAAPATAEAAAGSGGPPRAHEKKE